MSEKREYKNLNLTQFLEVINNQRFSWMTKRLSSNDTGLTGGHQVGFYIPKFFVQQVFPEINRVDVKNPDIYFDCQIPSHDHIQNGVRAIYYNGKFTDDGTRNEFRTTRWAGSPLLDVENTGSICLFAILRTEESVSSLCWITRTIEEEDLLESWLGNEVEPGEIYTSQILTSAEENESLESQLPQQWFSCFPSGREIFDFVAQKHPFSAWNKTLDELLLKRRKFEFEVFAEIERKDVLPNIKNGFDSVDEFIKYSNSIANRRKSRAGTSLELHLENIFRHKELKFETQAITEQRKKPDFLFPSCEAYHTPKFPSCKLHMLASKTCCKDRWRQVISEADRITPKHLFTLQEGVSTNQLKEMYDHGIILVVPQPVIRKFPDEYHDRILNLTGFIDFINQSQA